MTINTSDESGYLKPRVFEDELLYIRSNFQTIISNITGLPPERVKHDYQDFYNFIPNNNNEESYCYFHLASASNSGNYSPEIKKVDEETYILECNDVITFYLEFSGQNGFSYACRLCDGLYILQNTTNIAELGFGLINVSQINYSPVNQNNLWYNITNMEIVFNRQTKKTYNIFDLIGADIQLRTENELNNRTIVVRGS